MGFFTKFGDGAADVLPLAGLTKRRVRAVAEHMGAPRDLMFKVPTADLESDKPPRPDEEVYGVTKPTRKNAPFNSRRTSELNQFRADALGRASAGLRPP